MTPPPLLAGMTRDLEKRLARTEPLPCWSQDDGSVKCWGSNAMGALGYGDFPDLGDGSNGESGPLMA